MSVLDNIKGKLFEKAQNVSLIVGKNKEKEIKLGDAINTVSAVVSKTSEIVNEISDVTNNLADKFAENTSATENNTVYIEEENVTDEMETEQLNELPDEPKYEEDNQVMINQNEITETSTQTNNLEQGIAASLATQALNNSVIAETMAARPDLAIITGFQEVCRVLNNPLVLNTTKEIALDAGQTIRKGFDTYETCYTTALTTQLEAIKSSENFMLSAESEQNRHEEFMLLQQKEIFEKMLEVANHQFDSKVDFIRSQQQNLDEFYKKDVALITEHIQVLEAERSKNMDNTKVYMRLSDDISKLEDSKMEMKREYRKATNQLTDTIKTLEIQMKYELTGQNSKLLGTQL